MVKNMKTFYKFRFIPLILGISTLITGLILRYLVSVYTESTIISVGFAVSVIGFIFLQTMRQLKREESEKQQITQTPDENEQNPIITEIENNQYQRKNSIPFLTVRLFFSLILILFGISYIIDDRLLIGVLTIILASVIGILHIYWLIKYIQDLKTLKMIRKVMDSHKKDDE